MFVISSEGLNWKPPMVNTTFKGCYLILKYPYFLFSKFTFHSWVHKVQLFQQHLMRRASIALSCSIPVQMAISARRISGWCSPGSWNSCSTNPRCCGTAGFGHSLGTAGFGHSEFVQRAARQSQSCKSWARRPWRAHVIQNDFMALLVAMRERNLKIGTFFEVI